MNDNQQQPVQESKWKTFFLKSWQPVPSWKSTIIIFTIAGIVLIVFGIILTAVNANIVEVTGQYDASCQSLGIGQTCTVNFTIPQQMTPPVYIYYELHNFYQNHRRYIKSRSTGQLSGTNLTAAAVTSDCDPVIYNANLTNGKTLAWDNFTPLNPNAVAVPCGLIANSLFNDTYKLIMNSNYSQVPANETNIAWPSDVETKFRNTGSNWNQYQWQDQTNEHFIVWMRTAGLPTFRKLWASINWILPAGNYAIQIQNNYDVSQFQGQKWYVLSTTGPFGGKNLFLAVSYLVVGGICLLIAIFFAVRWSFIQQKKAV